MKFKVGDRVLCFGYDEDGVALNGRVHGKIFAIDGGWLHVGFKGDMKMYSMHPKQCRKLVKKERRRVWVLFPDNRLIAEVVAPNTLGAKEFVEVRPSLKSKK